MRPVTIERFRTRIDRVLALLASRLDEELPLERLAATAAMSPFHFHRTWRALTGETIGETVRRLRLERAARQLTGSEASITDVAASAGFASSQAFAHAFREATGMTPSAWRATGQAASSSGSTGDAPPTPFRVEIVELEPFTIIAHRHVGSYDTEALSAAFGVPWTWAGEHGLQAHLRGIWGRPWDDPASVPIGHLRFDAGFQFDRDVVAPPHLTRLDIPGGTYARVRLHGSYDGLEPLYQYLLGEWLGRIAREPADAPLLNHYHNDPETTPVEELVTDVYLQVTPSP